MSAEVKKPASVGLYLQHIVCPVHHYQGLAITEDPKAGGTRITYGKCCGRWDTQRTWAVDSDTLLADVRQAIKQARALARSKR